jgi:hypothetical protein
MERAKSQLADANVLLLQKELQKLKTAFEEVKIQNISLQETVKELNSKLVVTPTMTKQDIQTTLPSTSWHANVSHNSTTVTKNKTSLKRSSESNLPESVVAFTRTARYSLTPQKSTIKDPQLLLQVHI